MRPGTSLAVQLSSQRISVYSCTPGCDKRLSCAWAKAERRERHENSAEEFADAKVVGLLGCNHNFWFAGDGAGKACPAGTRAGINRKGKAAAAPVQVRTGGRLHLPLVLS